MYAQTITYKGMVFTRTGKVGVAAKTHYRPTCNVAEYETTVTSKRWGTVEKRVWANAAGDVTEEL